MGKLMGMLVSKKAHLLFMEISLNQKQMEK